MAVEYADLTIDWLGYATVRIEGDGGPIVYFDPGRYGVLDGTWTPDRPDVVHPMSDAIAPQDGDLVCVSHAHHYDADGIERVAAPDATVAVCSAIDPASIDRPGAESSTAGIETLPGEVRTVDAHEELAVDGATVRTIPAYNESDGPHVRAAGDPYHRKGEGLGFLLSIGGIDVLVPGDTDVLPGHRALDVEVFLPPIGGTFTMDRKEATDLAELLDPRLVVPTHYNTFGAIETDDRAFAADVASRSIPVALDRM